MAKKAISLAKVFPTPGERADRLIADLARIESEADEFINDWIADNAVGGVPVGVQRQCLLDTNPFVKDGYSYSHALQLLRRKHIRD